jgi:hypothetical protein
MIKEHDRIVLAADLPAADMPGKGLRAGDVGTVVHVHREGPNGKAYEVEFVALDGETVTVATLLESQVRPIARHEIAHARRLTA